MNKLSKEKRNQLILVALATVGAVAGLWFFLMSAQLEKNKQIDGKIVETRKEIDKMKQAKKASTDVASDLNISAARLTDIENTMPSGDLYLWMINTIRRFNVAAYKVDMPNVGAPISGTTSMFPSFPYNQLTFQVSGSANYYDFGRFLADFENRFPYMRVQNLSYEPGGGTTPEEREKLAFHMDIVTLVKPNNL